jgi:tetratricopeptide (TPR) repeat protein
LRSLQICEKATNLEGYDVQIRDGLAKIYTSQGDYAKAEPLYLRIIQTQEKTMGAEHFDTAGRIGDLGDMYYEQGNYAKAESLYLRSLQIMEKIYNDKDSTVASLLDKLARIDVAYGRPAQAIRRFARALGIRERVDLHKADSESKMTFFLEALRDEDNNIYDLLLHNSLLPGARSLALAVSLSHKGRAAEVDLITHWALQGSLSSAEQKRRFIRWQELRRQYDFLYLHDTNKPGDAARQALQSQLAQLSTQISELELDAISYMKKSLKPLDPEHIVMQVGSKLAKSSALIEVMWIKPYQSGVLGPDWKRKGPPCYVALILFPDQRIDFVDLGDAEQIDQAVRAA